MITTESQDVLSSFSLRNKVAVVTGAGKGIGRRISQVLAEAGAEVIAVARTESDLHSLQEEARGRVIPWCEDATSPAFRERLKALPQLDILVNNVGTNKPEPVVEVSEPTLDRVLDLNVRSVYLTTQAAITCMLTNGRGSIVNITSDMGHVGAVNRSVYCMTKHAIEGMTKAIAVELADQGVRVNSVAPTFIETPLTEPMLADPVFKKDVLSKIPMGRVGSVDEVAMAVLYLASEASSLTTGSCLKVDGGWTAI